MSVSDILKTAQKFAIDNSPTILTTVGVIGTVTTAVLTGVASYKAAGIIDTDELLGRSENRTEEIKRNIRLVWPLYIPAVGTGLITVITIGCSNRISSRRAAGLAAAYSLSERGFEEYRKKVIASMGEKSEQQVRDEVAAERVLNTPGSREVIIVGTDVLCHDAFTGRYFNGTVDGLKKAENELNHRILNNGYASLSDLYELIGLSKTDSSDEIGWRSEALFEFEFSTVLSEDGRPCLSVSYRVEPVRNYYKFG
jgi:hypothetical protein